MVADRTNIKSCRQVPSVEQLYSYDTRDMLRARDRGSVQSMQSLLSKLPFEGLGGDPMHQGTCREVLRRLTGVRVMLSFQVQAWGSGRTPSGQPCSSSLIIPRTVRPPYGSLPDCCLTPVAWNSHQLLLIHQQPCIPDNIPVPAGASFLHM